MKLKVQVLVSTMHQTDFSLLEKMNIQSDAIVINQCEHDEINNFLFNGHSVIWMSLNERGIGRSRNTALLRATGDILLFADDDVQYSDGYAEIISNFFEEHKNVDVAVFNVNSSNSERPIKEVCTSYRLRWYNSLKFGAVRIAVRRSAIEKRGVFFSLMFGGGAKYQSGEDTLFLRHCLKTGMYGVASNLHIGIVHQQESTWFKGYDETYFHDKGVLMQQLFGNWACVLLIPLIARNPDQYGDLGFLRAVRCAYKGLHEP